MQLIVAEFHFDEIDTSDLLIDKNCAAVEVPIRYRHRETGVPFESDQSEFLDSGRRMAGEAHRISRHRAGAGFRAAVAGAHPA